MPVKARAHTYDHHVNLRDCVRAILAREGHIAADQSAFSHLAEFERPTRRNARQAYMELEFE